MQILGDARPFPFQRAFLFGALQPKLEFPPLHQAHRHTYAREHKNGEESAEPPRLPETDNDKVFK